MKISKNQLRKIIKEELKRLILEVRPNTFQTGGLYDPRPEDEEFQPRDPDEASEFLGPGYDPTEDPKFSVFDDKTFSASSKAPLGLPSFQQASDMVRRSKEANETANQAREQIKKIFMAKDANMAYEHTTAPQAKFPWNRIGGSSTSFLRLMVPSGDITKDKVSLEDWEGNIKEYTIKELAELSIQLSDWDDEFGEAPWDLVVMLWGSDNEKEFADDWIADNADKYGSEKAAEKAWKAFMWSMAVNKWVDEVDHG